MGSREVHNWKVSLHNGTANWLQHFHGATGFKHFQSGKGMEYGLTKKRANFLSECVLPMAPKCQVTFSELIHTHCLCVRNLQQKSTECVKVSRLDFPLPRETQFLICPSAAICTLKGNTPSPAVIKRPSTRLCRCLAGPCSEHGGAWASHQRQSSSRGQVLRAARPMHCLSKNPHMPNAGHIDPFR